jgi:hypothetical protein
MARAARHTPRCIEMVGVRKVRVKLLDRALGTLSLVVEWRQTETCG